MQAWGLSPEILLKKSLWPDGCNFIKKESLTQMFSCRFCEISKITFLTQNTSWRLLLLFWKNYQYVQLNITYNNVKERFKGISQHLSKSSKYTKAWQLFNVNKQNCASVYITWVRCGSFQQEKYFITIEFHDWRHL